MEQTHDFNQENTWFSIVFPGICWWFRPKKTTEKKPRHARYAAGASASSRDVNADGSQAIGANKLVFFLEKSDWKIDDFRGATPEILGNLHIVSYYHILLEKVGYQFLAHVQLGHKCGYSNCDVDLVPNNIW